MNTGFVYVLLNPSFPELVKIGLTKRKPEVRARELRTTGVPADYIVIYDEMVSDCLTVERAVHKRFAKYREFSDREFSRIPVKEAVRALQEEANGYRVSPENLSRRVEILPHLKELYHGWLKPDIVSVSIVQPPGICFLQITRQAEELSESKIVEREDLQVFVKGDDSDSMFSSEATVEQNTAKFLNELDAYSLIMTGMPLFTRQAIQEIAHIWEMRH